jgi:hypothetical protein
VLLPLSPSLPRRAPRPQDLPQNPPPAYPAPGREPWPGPFAGPPTAREGLAARVGLAAAFWFSAKFITMCFPPNRLTRKAPTLYLPWRRPRRKEDEEAQDLCQVLSPFPSSRDQKTKGKEKKREKKERKGADGKTPTLELGWRGQRPDRAPLREGSPSRFFPIPPTPSLPREVRNIGEIEAKDGLPSADRNNKATLLLTGPFRTAKSSAKDLTPLVLKLQYAKYRGPLRGPRRNRLLRH